MQIRNCGSVLSSICSSSEIPNMVHLFDHQIMFLILDQWLYTHQMHFWIQGSLNDLAVLIHYLLISFMQFKLYRYSSCLETNLLKLSCQQTYKFDKQNHYEHEYLRHFKLQQWQVQGCGILLARLRRIKRGHVEYIIFKKDNYFKRKRITQQVHLFYYISVATIHILTFLSSPRLLCCFHVLPSMLSF